MPKKSVATDTGNGRVEEVHSIGDGDDASGPEASDNRDDVIVATATVGIICVGAALIETALIPGMIIGVAAMLVPKALPKLGAAVEPVFRGAVRGAYKLGQKARHVMAEAQEQVHDIVAEENAAEAAEKRDG